MKNIHPVTFILVLLTLATLVLTTGTGIAPWYAALIVAATTMALTLVLLAVLMLFAGQHRHRLWEVFISTVRQDLAPLVTLYRMIRKPR